MGDFRHVLAFDDLNVVERTLCSQTDKELIQSDVDRGWSKGDEHENRYDTNDWVPPKDKSRDKDFWSLVERIDWEKAERGGFPYSEFVGEGRPREARMHIMGNMLLVRASKTHAVNRTIPPTHFRSLRPSQIASAAKPEMLITDVLPCAGVVVLSAKPAAGKSLLIQDMLFHLAIGKDWHGHKVEKSRSLWIAAEGSAGLSGRFQAWSLSHGLSLEELDSPRILTHAVDLTDESQVDSLIRTIHDMSYIEDGAPEFDPPKVVVIDTLARCFGHGDENNAKDMNKFIEGVDRIVAVTGATVILVHHLGKDESRGPRGSSSLVAAATDAWRLSNDRGVLRMSVTKSKDSGGFEDKHFQIEQVHLGPQGATSVVLKHIETANTSSNEADGRDCKWGNALTQLLTQEGELSYSELKSNLVKAGCPPSSAEKTICRLKNQCVIENHDGKYRIIG